MSNPRSRKWFGTVWNTEDLDYIKKLKWQYILISNLDHTEDEQPHWHVFIQFNSNRTRPNTKNAHWEIPQSISGAVEYCKSKGTPTYEMGDL